MVNFVETDDLTQCPFVGAQILQSSGIYDAATASQVKVIQNWFNCYNRQEGDKSTISANGNVGESTWSELCTYAYQFPKGSGSSVSPYLKASIIAGKNAGC
jgi:hypothetical protein